MHNIITKTAILTALILLGLMLFSGCNTSSTYRLSPSSLLPVDNPENIEMFVGEIQKPHKKIAIVQSRFYSDQSKVTKKKMLEDIRNEAAKNGADAVMDIHMLPKKFEGMVTDEKIPFPAWKPGDYYAYFLRGVAIVYTEENAPQKD